MKVTSNIKMKNVEYCCLCSFLLISLSCSPLSETPKNLSSTPTPEQSKTPSDLRPDQWMTYYYLKPQPDLTPKMILAMSRDGILEMENAPPPITSFMSRIFAQNPNEIRSWFVQFDSLPKEHKKFLWQALWYADTKEAKEQLRLIAEKSDSFDKAYLEKLLKSNPPALTDIEINSPGVLDMQWGAFSATGDERYVIRIMSALPSVNEKEDTIKKALGGVARWSMASNCVQHEKVLQICKEQVSKQPKEISAILSGIIQEAEVEKRKASSSK